MLVPLSCKGRGFCPSCGARRMAETAASLVHELIPHVPVRQFVVTFPPPLRLWLARSTALATTVCNKVTRGSDSPSPPRERCGGWTCQLYHLYAALRWRGQSQRPSAYHRFRWKPTNEVREGSPHEPELTSSDGERFLRAKVHRLTQVHPRSTAGGRV